MHTPYVTAFTLQLVHASQFCPVRVMVPANPSPHRQVMDPADELLYWGQRVQWLRASPKLPAAHWVQSAGLCMPAPV